MLNQALQCFKEKAIGDMADSLAGSVTEDIRKEFQTLKRRCMIDTRKRCEVAVKNELDEFVHQMKLGQMNSETDINFKVDLLRQIMEEALE